MKYLTANGKYYELRWVNGEVAASSKNMETIVEGGGGGGYAYGGTGYTAPVSIRSRTVVHDEVFLIDREGREHAFQLSTFNLACRPGNQLLVLWAVKQGKKSGHYIVVHNRTTGKSYFSKESIRRMFRLHWIIPVAASVLLISLKLYFWVAVVFGVWIFLTLRGASRFMKGFDAEAYP